LGKRAPWDNFQPHPPIDGAGRGEKLCSRDPEGLPGGGGGPSFPAKRATGTPRARDPPHPPGPWADIGASLRPNGLGGPKSGVPGRPPGCGFRAQNWEQIRKTGVSMAGPSVCRQGRPGRTRESGRRAPRKAALGPRRCPPGRRGRTRDRPAHRAHMVFSEKPTGQPKVKRSFCAPNLENERDTAEGGGGNPRLGEILPPRGTGGAGRWSFGRFLLPPREEWFFWPPFAFGPQKMGGRVIMVD